MVAWWARGRETGLNDPPLTPSSPPLCAASRTDQECQQAPGDQDGGRAWTHPMGDNIAHPPWSVRGLQPASLTSRPVLFTSVSPAPRRFLEKQSDSETRLQSVRQLEQVLFLLHLPPSVSTRTAAAPGVGGRAHLDHGCCGPLRPPPPPLRERGDRREAVRGGLCPEGGLFSQ